MQAENANISDTVELWLDLIECTDFWSKCTKAIFKDACVKIFFF